MAYGAHSGELFRYFFREQLPDRPSIVFTTGSPNDQTIPGAKYIFAQLHQALALSEYDTLVHWEHPVILLHLTYEFSAAFEQLIQLFEQSLRHFHP